MSRNCAFVVWIVVVPPFLKPIWVSGMIDHSLCLVSLRSIASNSLSMQDSIAIGRKLSITFPFEGSFNKRMSLLVLRYYGSSASPLKIYLISSKAFSLASWSSWRILPFIPSGPGALSLAMSDKMGAFSEVPPGPTNPSSSSVQGWSTALKINFEYTVPLNLEAKSLAI